MTAVTYCTFLLTRQYTKNPELCSLGCGDEFGSELNWNGALNPVLWHALNVFFFSKSSMYVGFTLMRGNSKSDTLKRKMTIEKTTRH